MSSKSNLAETNFLKLLYQNIAWANIGNAGGLPVSTTTGSFYIALFTVSTGETDVGTEATYTSYARVAVARTVGGWNIGADGSGDAKISNAAPVTFPQSTGGSNTISDFGVYTDPTAGDLVHYGSVGTPLLISSGDTPKFNVDALIIVEK